MSTLSIIQLILAIVMALENFFSAREANSPPAPTPGVVNQRVDSRPEFSTKPHLLIVYNFPFTEKDSELYDFIKNDPEMKKIVNQVNINQWNNKFAWVRNSKWGEYLDAKARPIIILQEPAGVDGKAKVVYLRSGDEVLVNEKLPKELQEAIDKMGLGVEGEDVPGVEVRRGILRWIFRTVDEEESEGCRKGRCPQK